MLNPMVLYITNQLNYILPVNISYKFLGQMEIVGFQLIIVSPEIMTAKIP